MSARPSSKFWVSIGTSVAISGSIVFVIDFLVWSRFASINIVILFLCMTVVSYLLMATIRVQIWTHLAMIFGSTVFALCLAEVIFQAVILKPYVPSTDAELHSLIASSWPRAIEENRAGNENIRIVGYDDFRDVLRTFQKNAGQLVVAPVLA